MATYADQTMQVGQTIQYTTSPKNASGGGAPLDGNITFAPSPTGIVSITGTQPFGGNTTGNIVGTAVGTVTITATDTSVGVALTESFKIVVTEKPAVTFGFGFSTPA